MYKIDKSCFLLAIEMAEILLKVKMED